MLFLMRALAPMVESGSGIVENSEKPRNRSEGEEMCLSLTAKFG
jgi:hypothetical protein